MKTLTNEKGFIKPLLIIIVLLFLAYTGIKFAMPYYKYQSVKSETKELARISLGHEEKLRKMVQDMVEEHDIPVRYESIYIEKGINSIRVKITWSEEVDILGFYQKRLFFDVDVEE